MSREEIMDRIVMAKASPPWFVGRTASGSAMATANDEPVAVFADVETAHIVVDLVNAVWRESLCRKGCRCGEGG